MPLQREFKGLADHLGLYLAGKVPVELNTFLNQQISAEDFVNPPDFFRWQGVSAAQAVVVSSGAIPEGEMRRVRWIGCSMTGAATSSGIMAPVVFHLDDYFGVNPLYINAPGDLPAVNATIVSGWTLPGNGLLLLPGMAIGLQTQVYTGVGNLTVRGVYQAQTIKI